jgi:hypothetical protein
VKVRVAAVSAEHDALSPADGPGQLDKTDRWPYTDGGGTARASDRVLQCLRADRARPSRIRDAPDPAWISGYWDDGDFDDVVIAVYLVRPSASSLAETPAAAGLIRVPPTI